MWKGWGMPKPPIAPSGDQFMIEGHGYEAVITEGGATLRSLQFNGRPLIDGFGLDEIPTGGRGQLLMPWTNRIGDGRYEFEGKSYQLPLSEPAMNNASHGLVRWVAWTVVEQTPSSVSLGYRLMAQSGYPWTLDLSVDYAVGAEGLKVTQAATNRASTNAPYASGAHPYLTLGVQIDSLELSLPAALRLTTDERKLPTGAVEVTGSEFDFRETRVIGDTQWDHAVTQLTVTPLTGESEDRCWVTLRDETDDLGVGLWADAHHAWLQVYSGDANPFGRRRSLAVEPMTAPPDAFRTGTDVITLAPAGETADSFSASWGIRAL